MAKRATTEDILSAARKVATDMPSKKSVSRKERHLRNTFESLARSGRTKSQNPKYVTLFDRNYVQFRDWSNENGFSLDTELELLGKHQAEGTKIVRETVPPEEHDYPDWWKIRRIVLVTKEEQEEFPESRWVTDYESVRWVSHDNLARRRKKFILTAYGEIRLKKRRKPLLLELNGETKCASKWAADPRCQVSDKVLKVRKEEKVRVPTEFGHPFQNNSATDSDLIRPPIPTEFGHPLRFVCG